MPKPLEFPELRTARFPEGTLAAIDAVLVPGETMADAIREAVAEWVRKRAKQRRAA